MQDNAQNDKEHRQKVKDNLSGQITPQNRSRFHQTSSIKLKLSVTLGKKSLNCKQKTVFAISLPKQRENALGGIGGK